MPEHARTGLIVLAALIALSLFAGTATASGENYKTVSWCQRQYAPTGICVGHGGYKTCWWSADYRYRLFREFTLFLPAKGYATLTFAVVQVRKGRPVIISALAKPQTALQELAAARRMELAKGCLEPIE